MEMTADKFAEMLSKQEKVIAKQMEDGFRIIAAELKAAMAERDAQWQKEMAENAVTIATLKAEDEKKSNEINVIFKRLRAMEETDLMQEKFISQQKGSEKAKKEYLRSHESWLNRWIPSLITLVVVFIAWALNRFWGKE